MLQDKTESYLSQNTNKLMMKKTIYRKKVTHFYYFTFTYWRVSYECFPPNLLQLIVTNPVDHFKHRHFQVEDITFLFLFMVPFFDFMHIFQGFENAPLEGQKVHLSRVKYNGGSAATHYLPLGGCIECNPQLGFSCFPQNFTSFLHEINPNDSPCDVAGVY